MTTSVVMCQPRDACIDLYSAIKVQMAPPRRDIAFLAGRSGEDPVADWKAVVGAVQPFVCLLVIGVV